MNFKFRGFCLLACTGFCLLVSGCGTSPVIVTGKVTQGGKPVALKSGERIKLTFYTADEGVTPDYFKTGALPDGTYRMTGNRDRGIPRGTYRIAVEIFKGQSDSDRLRGEFGPQTSPIMRTVDGKGDINIDLDHPTEQK